MVTRITERILIGNYREAADRGLLAEHEIGAILSLSDAPRGLPEDLGVKRKESVPLNDGKNFIPDLERALRLTAELSRDSQLLVHCRAGRSRSPGVVAAHLARTENADFDDALQAIADLREINVTSELCRQLRALVLAGKE